MPQRPGAGTVPVALFIFNRPELTHRVLDAVAVARPAQLLVVADGPRPDHPDDGDLVRAARSALDRVDWPCEVQTCFSDVNLGCGRRIASGLDWVFDQVEEAIILEDDCLPNPSFFGFCEELLGRYREDERVFMISGSNVLEPDPFVRNSYCFSRGYQIWGWATWRRAWRHYDYDMRAWPQLRDSGWLAEHLRSVAGAEAARVLFDMTFDGRIQQWDFQWVLAGWLQNALAVVPGVNLVANIGYGQAATHLTDAGDRLAQLPAQAMSFPLRHPPEVEVLEERDATVWEMTLSRQQVASPAADQLDSGRMPRTRALASQLRILAADERWMLPLLVRRLSGRRRPASPELYRAGILGQRLRRGRLPGMTAATERAYFRWHAQERFAGHGTIVDLGSWFGSTTVSLASGLARNPKPAARRQRIHAFDRFEWEWWMAPYASAAKLGSYADGESFQPEFERVVARWRQWIEVHAGDLREQSWTGEPIELLLVDAMKSWELTDAILRGFYPDLLEGAGHVIHQDFSNAFTPWIHLTTYRLREHLTPTVDVVRSETMVFALGRSLRDEPELLRASRADFDDAEVDRAFRHSLAITRADKHSGIHAARAMLAYFDGDLERARVYVEHTEGTGELDRFHADAVRRAMVPAGADG